MRKQNKFVFSQRLDNKQLFEVRLLKLRIAEKKRIAKQERQELELKLAIKTNKTKRKIEKLANKVEFDAKSLYIRGGHLKNELLAMLVYNANGYRDMKVERGIHFDEANHKLYLNTYQRADRDASVKANVIVYIHGGGWVGGFPEAREGVVSRYVEQGYFAVSIYYGEAPEFAHPKMIENVYKAFAWIKDNAEKYNINADEIIVTGESAGAYLSAMAGAISSNEEYKARFNLDEKSKDQKIAGLILNCGVYDFERLININFRNVGIYTQSYLGGRKVCELDEETKKEVSPIYWVTKDFPPTFAIAGENDKLAILTFDLVEKLFDNDVKVEEYLGKGKYAVHAFAIAQSLKISREALSLSLDFIKDLII